jgi:O-6-methylguanine DNA methyltransferase
MGKVERELEALGRERAPEGFHARVMVAAGVGDEYAPIETPIGTFFVAWNRMGVSAVQLMAEAQFRAWFHKDVGRLLRRSASVPAWVSARVLETRGRGIRYDLRSLTPFEHAVLMKTLEIPRGEVRTYSWVAKEIGHPKAVRAVGSALANNPIPLLIPCHRVVRSDGVIGNYGAGGPENKRALLSLEGVAVDELETLARRRVRFIGSDTTHIFCVPTCHTGRHMMVRHRQEFASDAEARARGYRPCKVCRPAGAAEVA